MKLKFLRIRKIVLRTTSGKRAISSSSSWSKERCHGSTESRKRIFRAKESRKFLKFEV